MSNKNFVLCKCSKCKKNGIGEYVHPTTKWRHSKKRKYNIELIDDDIDHYNEKYSSCDDDDSDDKYNDYEVYNRLYSEILIILKIIVTNLIVLLVITKRNLIMKKNLIMKRNFITKRNLIMKNFIMKRNLIMKKNFITKKLIMKKLLMKNLFMMTEKNRSLQVIQQ